MASKKGVADDLVVDTQLTSATFYIYDDKAINAEATLLKTGQENNSEGIFLGMGALSILGTFVLRKRELSDEKTK